MPFFRLVNLYNLHHQDQKILVATALLRVLVSAMINYF